MIQLLSKEVSDKIAAGEVVDRPLSIVKELVENALDAGADSLVVEIRNGGKSYIRVSDNGIGIGPDEVEIAFLRHATSKIRQAEDLNHIRTLGFRGEALSSIAAVTRIELLTKRREDKTGTRLILSGGQIIDQKPVGCPDGTTIVVEDLFYNTPARLKFLKSDAAETGVITDFMSKIALAYDQCQIRFICNGNTLFTTMGKGNRLQNILTVYDRTIQDHLLPVESEGEDYTLRGYVSKPSFTKTSRKYQIHFVNGRVITSRLLDQAVEEAYREKMFDGRFPVVFLFLDAEPGKLDVNIHPNKKEIRFEEEDRVRELVAQAIRRGLDRPESVPVIEKKIKQEKTFVFPDPVSVSTPIPEAPIEFRASTPIREEQVDIKNILSTMRREEVQKETWTAKETMELPVMAPAMEELTVLGSVFSSYILASGEQHFYLIDQHAAHERITYEKLLMGSRNGNQAVQHLLVPFIQSLTYGERQHLEDWIRFFSRLGYEAEEFGPNDFRITGVPAFLSLEEARNFLRYLTENIQEDVDLNNPSMQEKIVARACKSSVKAGDSLKREEMDHLIKELFHCENPYSCPHGRPTLIRLSKGEIERMFKRI